MLSNALSSFHFWIIVALCKNNMVTRHESLSLTTSYITDFSQLFHYFSQLFQFVQTNSLRLFLTNLTYLRISDLWALLPRLVSHVMSPSQGTWLKVVMALY